VKELKAKAARLCQAAGVGQSQPRPHRCALPIYCQCGGCQLQHVDYATQLLVEAPAGRGQPDVDQEAAGARRDGELGRVYRDVVIFGSMEFPRYPGSWHAWHPWRYRNKAQMPICVTEDGLVGCFYTRGSHRIIDMEASLIQHVSNDEGRCPRECDRPGISANDEESGQGLLRHVFVKVDLRHRRDDDGSCDQRGQEPAAIGG